MYKVLIYVYIYISIYYCNNNYFIKYRIAIAIYVRF